MARARTPQNRTNAVQKLDPVQVHTFQKMHTLEKAHNTPALWAQQALSAALPDVVAHFLLSLRAAQTRISYAASLREFFEFAHTQQLSMSTINDITEPVVLAWLACLKQKHSRSQGPRVRAVQATVARKLSTLSSLLEFSRKRSLVKINCVDLVSRPKLKCESKTNAFTPDEIERVLSALSDACRVTSTCKASSPHASEKSAKGEKNKHLTAQNSAYLRLAVLQTLFSVGMRVEELCTLRIADFEDVPHAPRLHLRTKGGEHHAPFLHDSTARILRIYLAQFRAHAPSDAPLFIRAQDVREVTFLHRSSVFDMVKEAALLAGIDKKVSPHSCRATLATLLHNQGVPMGQIQDLLNHKQITTTALYVKKAQEVEHAAALKLDLFALAKAAAPPAEDAPQSPHAKSGDV